MARGMLRGAASAWLGLIALQVLTTDHGSGTVAGAFSVLNGLVQRALDPNVAAIPDHTAPALPGATAGTPRLTKDGLPDYNVPSPVPPPAHKIPVPQP